MRHARRVITWCRGGGQISAAPPAGVYITGAAIEHRTPRQKMAGFESLYPPTGGMGFEEDEDLEIVPLAKKRRLVLTMGPKFRPEHETPFVSRFDGVLWRGTPETHAHASTRRWPPMPRSSSRKRQVAMRTCHSSILSWTKSPKACNTTQTSTSCWYGAGSCVRCPFPFT